MKNKFAVLSIVPFLLGIVGCETTQTSQNNTSSDNSSEDSSEAYRIPYEKLFRSRWIIGNDEPPQIVSQYEVYINIDTEDIYYFDNNVIRRL